MNKCIWFENRISNLLFRCLICYWFMIECSTALLTALSVTWIWIRLSPCDIFIGYFNLASFWPINQNSIQLELQFYSCAINLLRTSIKIEHKSVHNECTTPYCQWQRILFNLSSLLYDIVVTVLCFLWLSLSIASEAGKIHSVRTTGKNERFTKSDG